MTDDMIEAVARALCQNALEGKQCPCAERGVFNCADAYPGYQAHAAIRAAAPLILDMAADVVDDAEYAGFVRQLKERFQ
jgi:hypothetical protein